MGDAAHPEVIIVSDHQRPAHRIRALITDVDGVLTDGGMYFDAQGQAAKRFNVKDGFIVGTMRRAGVLLAWISGDDSDITRARAQRLGIAEVYSGVEDKGECLRDLMERHGLRPQEVAYMGDDLNDLPAMRLVGFSACPADAMPAVAAAAHYVATRRGGEGAFREVCDLILLWNSELDRKSAG